MENEKTILSVRMKERVLTAFKPGKTIDAQNAWNLYADIAWWGILAGIVSTFLSVFVIRLGGSDMHVGLLSALPALVTIFASIPGSRLVERETKPLLVLLVSAFLNRLGYLLVALVPLFFLTNRADVVVVLVGLLAIPGAVANVAFTTMFGHAVEPEHRARVVSIRNVWIGITSTAIALIGGKFLDLLEFPINYQILFAVAFAGSMMSQYYLTRIRMPADPAPVRTMASPRRGRGYFAMFRESRGFARFALTSFIFHWGLFFAVPLYSIYWVRHLNASDGWVGLINMVGSATTIFFFPLWGRLTAQRGNRPAVILATMGLTLYPFFTALSPSVEWILVVSLLGGVFSSGYALAFFNGLLEVCPEENRASHIAAYNTLINIAAFVSPILSTSLTDVFGIQAMLMLGAGLRLLGALLIWRGDVLVSEPR
ncbi:MAG: MFS transporter [Chloroflexota bacterium]|nr:MFS transporter [Chloroflexota bacterium]